MKIKKIMLAGLIMIAMNLSLIACGKEEKEALRGTSEQKTESTKQTEEIESGEETGSGEESASEEESVSEEAPDRETGSESSEESSEESGEASTEFAVPIQEDFTPVEGLSDKYVDFENRSFAYNGKVFKLGESTLKNLIDGGRVSAVISKNMLPPCAAA